MKKILFATVILLFFSQGMYAQSSDDHSAIKLFVSISDIKNNNKNLADNLQQRLLSKVTQLINQTGVAEIGYSNFYVTPKVDIISTSVDQSGIAKIHLAECELILTISRRDYDGDGGAVYNSFSKRLIGSGSTEKDAIANAVTNISTSDKKIVEFLKGSRVKIDEYFKLHCEEVLKEAEQSYDLKLYSQSIALYFSVPSNSTCYERARDKSIQVYVKFKEDECNVLLLKLKSYVAMGQVSENATKNYYDSALAIMGGLGKSTSVCYQAASKEIAKIEKQLSESQKRIWEVEEKKAANTHELEKEMIKAMGKISSTYQPSSSPAMNTIIVK